MSDLDSVFNEFARTFVGTVKDSNDIALPEALDRSQLNGTVESLHEVDRYLTRLHEIHSQLDKQELHFTLLRAGAYVGEVIRHAAPAGEFEWVDYNDYMPLHPTLQPLIP